MYSELEKIDILRERMGVTYREAKEVLEEAGGDLVEALIKVEENKKQGWSAKVSGTIGEIIDEIKKYIDKGNRTRIRLKRGDQTVADLPATVGALGVLAAMLSIELAVVAGVGAVAAVANKITVEIEQADGETKVISLDRHRDEY